MNTMISGYYKESFLNLLLASASKRHCCYHRNFILFCYFLTTSLVRKMILCSILFTCCWNKGNSYFPLIEASSHDLNRNESTSFKFSRLASIKCNNKMIIKTRWNLSRVNCKNICERNIECAAFEHQWKKCVLLRRCDGKYSNKICSTNSGKLCTMKKRRIMDNINLKYEVQACVTDKIVDGQPCKLENVSNFLQYSKQPAQQNCEETNGQKGSITYVDLILPPGKVLYVRVKTKVLGQNSNRGFFVRPTHITQKWGKAVVSKTSASFYLADTGQFSVEFAPQSMWRIYKKVSEFEGLMIFVNPPIALPQNLIPISPKSVTKVENLGPNKRYLFVAGIDYDWKDDHVFKVHDDTSIYFEQGAHVRARIVQTEKKVKNVLLKGYGTLDVHYDLEDDVVGISDDATRQNVGIYGKNIQVIGLTLVNSNPTCGHFGYCLNINANWSPLTNNKDDPFDAFEMQGGNPPYKFRQAHCQLKNMDDSPNTNFDNCPTSRYDGQTVSYVKCMTWQLGQDGLNAGKWGTVTKSFVRTMDDAIKPWDSHGIYQDITIWQLMQGWPINLGWWNWNQPDINTVVDSIYVIHNHNWVTSPEWPVTNSGQCVIGGIYGSGAVKQGYKFSNIFVETAASCAVGLQISNKAYSRHLTPEGCVGSIQNTIIDGIYFDENFFQTGGYDNFLKGEANPGQACTGDLSGNIENMEISGFVAGRQLSRSDFIVPNSDTVQGLVFQTATDPNLSSRPYTKYQNKNAYYGSGGKEIDLQGVKVQAVAQCMDRCQADWSCHCVVFKRSTSMCWKRSKCFPAQFDNDINYDVYMRGFGSS